MSEETTNEGTWSGLKKTIIGTLTTVVTGGSLYSNPIVTFSAPSGGGTTATGTVVSSGGIVTGVTITQKGSGYSSAPTVTIVDSDGGAETTGTATAVLTTDSGNVGSTTNQENAIVMTAFLTGGSIGPVEVLKQVSTNRYKVTDGTRTGIVKLKASAVAAAGAGRPHADDGAGGRGVRAPAVGMDRRPLG